MAFRGIGKSWVTAAYVTWVLRCDPQAKVLVVSASKKRAADFTKFVQQLINEMPILQHLRAKDHQRQSTESFDVGPALADQSPSVKSAGITGQITGTRADVIIADDVEVPNNSATPMMREKLAEAVKEFDAILKPGGRIIFLGTPQTEESIYNALPERGYEVRIWPARYPAPSEAESTYQGRLAPLIARELSKPHLIGVTTEPLRFSDIDLQEREASWGRSGFALQFMLDTSLSDANRYPLKLSDLICMNLNPEIAPVHVTYASGDDYRVTDVPIVGLNGDKLHKPMQVSDEWAQYTGSVMTIDPSGRGKDETGYAIVKYLHGRLFLLDAGGYREGYTLAVLESLARKAKEYRVQLVLTEPNFGDGMFTQLLSPVLNRIYPVTIQESERSNAQKEKRIIDALEPVMNQHKLVVEKSLFLKDFKSTESFPNEEVNRYRLFWQMTRITKDRGSLPQDDRLDAVALAVHYWTREMARDANEAEAKFREDQLDRASREFVASYRGKPAQEALWQGSSKGLI
jgi:hypothetical protein